MGKEWKVSVLTPVHETDLALFTRACNSLKAQSFGFSDIQWVVVFHNCLDSYVKAALTLLSGCPNICSTVVNQDGTGVAYARNAALQKAEGTYVFFLDSDDEMQPDCIETVVSAMEKSSAVSAVFTAEKITLGGGRSLLWTDTNPSSGVQVYERGDRRIGRCMCLSGMNLWTRCYRRDFLAAGGYSFSEDFYFAEDYLFNVKVTGEAERICVLPDYCGYRYYEGIGMTSGLLNDSDRLYKNGPCADQNMEFSVLFLTRLYRYGKACGLDLGNLMWERLSAFGRYYLFSDLSDEFKRTYVNTVIPLAGILPPPLMECRDRQIEMDRHYKFVMSYCHL